MVSFTVFVGDRVVLVHNLEILVSLTVFARDRTVLVHDKEYNALGQHDL
jgi:hypothetical protein